MVLEGQLIAIVLAEYGIAVELCLARDAHIDDLFLVTDVCQKERRAENLSANELAVVDDVRVDVKYLVDVDHVLLLLSLGLHGFLMVFLGRQQRFGLVICHKCVLFIVSLG